MEMIAILVACFVATSAMTLFSYILSWILNEYFKEPELLKLVLAAVINFKHEKTKAFAAWAIHYSIGLLFVVCYDIIWSKTTLQPDSFSGLVLGVVSGIIAVVSWSVLLRIPKQIPKINKPIYYIQLIIAHVIFAFSAIAIYQAIL